VAVEQDHDAQCAEQALCLTWESSATASGLLHPEGGSDRRPLHQADPIGTSRSSGEATKSSQIQRPVLRWTKS